MCQYESPMVQLYYKQRNGTMQQHISHIHQEMVAMDHPQIFVHFWFGAVLRREHQTAARTEKHPKKTVLWLYLGWARRSGSCAHMPI